MARPDTSSLRTLLDPARHISILLPQKPHYDVVAAALGLKISLEAHEKQARVVCGDQMIVEYNRLVGVDTITNTFGSRNLIISFTGQTEHVDKVSYNLEKGELQLVITPKPESPELDHKQLRFISSAGKTDLIIVLGVEQLSDLGSLYTDVKEHMENTSVVSISHKPLRESFTTFQIHDHEAAAASEVVTSVIDSLNLPIDMDIASNLLSGIEKATNNFQSNNVNVGTFEAAVVLMKKGAKRHVAISASDFPPGAIPSNEPKTLPEKTEVKPEEKQTSQNNTGSQSGWGTDGSNQSQGSAQGQNQKKTKKDDGKAPADWYEPKIYKGPMLP